MCRIAAIVSENLDTLETRIIEMTKSMHRGGPDHQGILVDKSIGFALGHRRLSIIDLSDAANQPMHSGCGQYQLVFNGEIYNYKILIQKLKSEGVVLSTNSDTEVLLKGYIHWGIAVLEYLKGMFAFVLVDKVKNQLFAARDHAGIKPLYFANYGGDLYFASEVKAFSAANPAWEQNQEWPIWFLTYGFLPEPITTLKKVQPLQKGSYLIYNFLTKDVEQTTYHHNSYLEKVVSYEDAVQQTREAVISSVKSHMVADVPVGVFLSGGIDSSILAILAQKEQTNPINTLSIYFDDEKFSEKQYQDIVIHQTGVQHHSYKITKNDFVANWDNILNSLDQPTTDAINSHFICKQANELGLKVVLSGLGADEIFGGYPSFKRVLKLKTYQRIAAIQNIFNGSSFLSYPTKKIEFLSKKTLAGEYLFYRGLFLPKDVAKILEIPLQQVNNCLNTFKYPEEVKKLLPQNRVSYFESSTYMQSQLLKDSDVQSMWFGLELRVPFVDKDLIGVVNNIHPNIKYEANGKPKPLLVDAFKEELDERIWNRQKQGFTFPFEKWLKQIEVLQQNNYVPKNIHHQFMKDKLSWSRYWATFLAKTY